MATFGEKLLEHTRRAYQDVANGLIARVHELVRDAALQEEALAWRERSGLAIQNCGQLSFDDVDRLVVIRMNMDRRLRLPVTSVLEETELAFRLFAGNQPLHDDACEHKFLWFKICHCFIPA